ncbi:MAG: hypothetical protein V4537_18150 [Pseudomonadota bacterium]
MNPEHTIRSNANGLRAAAFVVDPNATTYVTVVHPPLRWWETRDWRPSLAAAATTLQERAWMLAERGRDEPREILASCDQQMAADCAAMARSLYVALCPMMAYVREVEAA